MWVEWLDEFFDCFGVLCGFVAAGGLAFLPCGEEREREEGCAEADVPPPDGSCGECAREELSDEHVGEVDARVDGQDEDDDGDDGHQRFDGGFEFDAGLWFGGWCDGEARFEW